MFDKQTCGKGLAEHAVIPAKISELLDLLAENLDLHLTTLDLSDGNSKREDDVYRMLVKEFCLIAARLEKITKRMAGFRNLPMGRHHANVMQDPSVFDVFEKFVKTEEELLDLLRTRVDQDRKMLVKMGKAGQ